MSTTPAIVQVVLELQDLLQRECIDDLEVGDDSRVGQVVIGRFAGDITKLRIVLAIHTTHPLGPKAGGDTMAEGEPRDSLDRPWQLPSETIGGSRFRKHLATVEVIANMRRDQEQTMLAVEKVKQRIEDVLTTSPSLIGLSDDHGYHVFEVDAASAYGYAGGAENVGTGRYWCDFVIRYSRKRKRRE